MHLVALELVQWRSVQTIFISMASQKDAVLAKLCVAFLEDQLYSDLTELLKEDTSGRAAMDFLCASYVHPCF